MDVAPLRFSNRGLVQDMWFLVFFSFSLFGGFGSHCRVGGRGCLSCGGWSGGWIRGRERGWCHYEVGGSMVRS